LRLTLLSFFFGASIVLAQADIAGEWAVEFAAPGGPAEFRMFVVQEGSKLSGRLSSPSGEDPLKGSIEANRFTIVWSHPIDGKIAEITFTGIVKGDSLSGNAKIAGLGEGALFGERIGR
jgi:hypothetical protein